LNNALNSPAPARGQALRWRWTLPLVWACLIFYLSTGTFGGNFSGLLLEQILRILHVTLSPPAFELAHLLFRKSAHVTEYGILGMLLYFSMMGTEEIIWTPRKALLSILIAGLYSLTDEFHQIFVPGRGPALHDCALDTSGVTLGILVIYTWTRLFPASNRTMAAKSEIPADA
jgi:VanZ family protein